VSGARIDVAIRCHIDEKLKACEFCLRDMSLGQIRRCPERARAKASTMLRDVGLML
jgi:hypothetical protein